MANEYKIQADGYFESSIYDSAVYAYEAASEIYWKYFETTTDKKLLRNFIYCQNYFALNIAIFGYIDTALFILGKSKSLCEHQIISNDECMSDNYFCFGSVYFMKNDFPNAFEYFNKALNLQQIIYGVNHKKCAFTYNFLGVVNDIMVNKKNISAVGCFSY